jgi:antitoxin CptB
LIRRNRASAALVSAIGRNTGERVSETRQIRLKRLRIRSWRRGTREMDLILGRYADEALGALEDGALDEYEAMLEQPDPDLYAWVSGTGEPGSAFRSTIERLRRFHQIG